jgi:hypothetical protein
LIITRNEHVSDGFCKGYVCGVGHAKSSGVQRFRAFSDGAEIMRRSGAIPV